MRLPGARHACVTFQWTRAFVQRVADALNGQDVSPEHVYNVLDNFYGMGEAAPVTRRWWE